MAQYVEATNGAVKAARWFCAENDSSAAVSVTLHTAIDMGDVRNAVSWVTAMTRGQLNCVAPEIRECIMNDLQYTAPGAEIAVPPAPSAAAATLIDNAYCVSIETCARFGVTPVILICGAGGPPMKIQVRAAGRQVSMAQPLQSI